MNSEFNFSGNDKVISLAAVRRQRQAVIAEVVRSIPAPPSDWNTVFFITGGQFEAMVNGSSGVLSARDFVRVPDGAAFAFVDVGTIPGAMLSHRFASDVEAGFLRELAAALPPFARALPQRGTPEYTRLKVIARRWGVRLGEAA